MTTHDPVNELFRAQLASLMADSGALGKERTINGDDAPRNAEHNARIPEIRVLLIEQFELEGFLNSDEKIGAFKSDVKLHLRGMVQ